MKDKSSMSLGRYLLDCLFYMAIAMIWYKNLLFRCLPGRTCDESKTVLWVMIGLSILICAFALNRSMRTGWTVTTALVVPFGLYTVLTYIKTVGNWMLIVLASAVTLSVIYTALIMKRKIKKRRTKVKVIKRRLHRCCVASQSIVAIALLMVMGTIGVQGVFGDSIWNSSISATASNQNEPQTIGNNIDTILLLQEEEWANLTTQEKLDTLQTVANIEAYYLGLPNELNVGAANLGKYTRACYNDRTYTISIDLNHLENDSVYDVLDSCCHEAYHSYQHRLVDAYNAADENFKGLRIYRPAARYGLEFSNYTDGDYDFCSYYYQDCEMDARDYAEDAVCDYYNRIFEYLNENLD